MDSEKFKMESSFEPRGDQPRDGALAPAAVDMHAHADAPQEPAVPGRLPDAQGDQQDQQ